MKPSKWKYGSNSLLMTLAAAASLILLYGILDRHPFRWDLTENRELSLSEQTEKVLKDIKSDVRVLAFFRRGDTLDDVFIRRKVDDVLKEYTHRSPKIDYKMIDPDAQIDLAVQHRIDTDGTLIFQSGKNRKEIYKSQLFDYSRMSEDSPPLFSGEGLFTNALLKVIQEGQNKACVMTGHGERSLEDQSPKGFSSIRDYLEKNNFEVMPLSLVSQPKMPGDCSLLIVAGPERQFADPEDHLIQQWIEGGGKILLMIEPLFSSPLPLLPPLPMTLRSLKITVNNDLVFDPKRHFVLGEHYPSPILEDHETVRDLRETTPILASARSLSVDTNESPDTHVLMKTSPEAWGETQLSGGSPPRFDKGKDIKGPLTLGVAIDLRKDDSTSPWAVVIGDADFASNGLIQAPGNLDLFLNLVGWLAEDKDQITIRPKTPEFRNITLTSGKARFIAYFTQLGYPLLVVLGTGAYWFRRRNS